MNQLSSIYTSLACTTGDDTDKLACLRGKSWEDTLDLTAANANVSQVMPVIDIAASVDPLFLRPALTGQPFDLITSGAFNKVRAMRCVVVLVIISSFCFGSTSTYSEQYTY